MKTGRSLFPLALLPLALALGAGPLFPAVPLKNIYSQAPSYKTALGGFSSGIVLVDLNKDGYDDMVLVNGSDMTPQPLSVYYNHLAAGKGTLFGQWPDWYSQEIGYNVAVASGDIDQDGWPDLIVIEVYNLKHDAGSGGFTVFRNDGKGSFILSSRIPIPGTIPLGCALADADVDGDLDAVIAVYSEQSGDRIVPGRGRVYLNENGIFSPNPAWMTAEHIGAAGVTAADVNQDGWMDLAFAADRPIVYYGEPRGGLGFISKWTGGLPHPFSFSIDAGWLQAEASSLISVPGGKGLTLAVSASASPFTFANCRDNCGLFLYDPQGFMIGPTWRSEPAQAVKLLFADLNDDGYLDLVGNQPGPVTPAAPGAPLLFFQGGKEGFDAKPSLVTTGEVVGQGLAFADLYRKKEVVEKQAFLAKAPVAVLTLPRRLVTVLGVTKNGQPLPYAWAPGANWISLATPLATGDSVVVEYRYSRRLDVAASTWNPLQGNQIYLSQ